MTTTQVHIFPFYDEWIMRCRLCREQHIGGLVDLIRFLQAHKDPLPTLAEEAS